MSLYYQSYPWWDHSDAVSLQQYYRRPAEPIYPAPAIHIILKSISKGNDSIVLYYILGSKIPFWKDPVIHIKCIYYSPYNTCVYREEADNDFVDGPSTVETKTSKQAQELVHSSSVRQTIARPTRWIRSSQQKKFLLQLISNKLLLLLLFGAILILQ